MSIKPFDCKRCGFEVYFSGGQCFGFSTMQPHNIAQCKTKTGYVWCPIHRNVFSQNNPCDHYRELGYRKGENESFFVERINSYGFRKRHTPSKDQLKILSRNDKKEKQIDMEAFLD